MASDKSINVFVSSAMYELEYDREIAQEVLMSLNVNPVLFEVLPAMSQSPSDCYLDEVRDCDIFVMLLWRSLRPAVSAEYEQGGYWPAMTLSPFPKRMRRSATFSLGC